MKHLDPIGKKGCPAANVRCSFEGCGMVGYYMKCCLKNPKRKQQQAKATESPLFEQSDLSEENKAHLFHVLHSCLGHATGQRLEATLKEKGVGVPYFVGECQKVRDTCKACREVNFRCRKLKRRGSAVRTRKHVSKPCEEPPVDGGEERERESEGLERSFNANIYHDLKDMKRKGIGGVRYVSVIVDLHTRRKSFWCCRSKDRTLAHLIAWMCSEIPMDVDVVAEQAAEEAATAETQFVRWSEMSNSQRERHVRERRKKRRELKGARIIEAFNSHLKIAYAVMKAEKVRKLLQRENDAKGHIIATEEEVAQGLFKEFDWKELARWYLCSMFDFSSETLQTKQGVKAVSLRWV
uniref:Uncharacterized protein n=1 Tax=Chromera velia CCMP2878 TaxID=1169474 RepID=A0A0G4GX95_9ALVE|eukprot:Cvel_23781.t1-p1 / transcript=Cvel_23781.t1 / gene=Cvel_23781 / organism=Chromera_velia_CCMP2878 / gene_product=hypothetical protein / transcript_product=hypothetical protein / location=Cvel_scaffold2495:13554-16416(+) / protein_length=351 / sequence_SO=supercontig / SO=protein_coding / is_pseudo=false